jgi:hypothetical protein
MMRFFLACAITALVTHEIVMCTGEIKLARWSCANEERDEDDEAELAAHR